MSTQLIAMSTMADHIDMPEDLTVADLRMLLEVAMIQMEDGLESDEAYGFDDGTADRLHTAAMSLLAALPMPPPEVGGTIEINGAFYTITGREPHHEEGAYVFTLASGPGEPDTITRGGYLS